MTRMLAGIPIFILCTTMTFSIYEAVAQQPVNRGDRQKTVEFARMYQLWLKTQDSKQNIAALEVMLKLEPDVRSFPDGLLAGASVRGTLLFHLGSAYIERRDGETENWEKAISAFEAALRFNFIPSEWAKLHNNLGIAYSNRVRGAMKDNLEKALLHHRAALSVLTREAHPQDWSATQNNLGSTYSRRMNGVRADNIEMAIAAYEAALTTATREDFPQAWARTQHNLAIAYKDRIKGVRADNVESAIAAFEAALTIYTQTTSPHDWAETQNSLGNAFSRRLYGSRSDNQEKAFAAYRAALTVWTRESAPRNWAQTQHNLGMQLFHRKRGIRTENQENAIAAVESALTVLTVDAFPHNWAQSTHVLAGMLRRRIHGSHIENVRRAVSHFEAVLTIFSRLAFPREHLNAARDLGAALMELGEWSKASSAFAGARDAFFVLFGEGLNELEALDVVKQASGLFAEAAFSRLQQGEIEAALELALEGKARLLAVALKQQMLELSFDSRLHLEQLRTAIRVEDRAAEQSRGIDRANAIEKLTALRQELLGLIVKTDAAITKPGIALSQMRALVDSTDAIIVPIVTEIGAKFLIVGAVDGNNTITVLDLPELTTDTLNVVISGASDKSSGWLGAYKINYIVDEAEKERRWPDWTDAIGKLGPELWRLFGGRLDAALKKSGVRLGARLVWMPSGVLGILPLAIAQDPIRGRYLADDYEIVYAPSLEALTSARDFIAKRTNYSLAAIINPSGDLPGTEIEGAIVVSHFTQDSSVLIQGESATVDTVLVALKGKSHWHFASHGNFSWSDARQSALMMSRGTRLTADQLLAASGLGRPRLVVLSACETGLYDIGETPDEFIGLPGTFTALGAAGVLGTLWPVSDDATALIMAKFYELHIEADLAPPTALRAAQAWLRQATNDELNVYAKSSTAHGRITNRQLQELERKLSPEGLLRSRNSSITEWVQRGWKPVVSDTEPSKVTSLARPYAHPYFWAAFIHTGL